jgi:hypothetical protein
MRPEEKASWAKEAATRFEKLPALPRPATAELSAAQEEGFYAGVAAGYSGGRLETFLTSLGAATATVLILAVAAERRLLEASYRVFWRAGPGARRS